MIIEIEDIDDPRIAYFRERRDRPFVEENLVIVDGFKNIERCLEIGIPLKSIMGKESVFTTHAFDSSVVCYSVSASLMHQVIGYKYHMGMIAVAERPGNRGLADLGDRIVAFENVVDAENVGAILRSAHAFGATGTLGGGSSCSPFVRRAIRVSMASAFSLAVRETNDFIGDLYHLGELGYKIYGADINGDVSVPLGAVANQAVLVLGNEDKGLSLDAAKACSALIKIPMVSTIDSLNVAHAATVLCWEFFGRKP